MIELYKYISFKEDKSLDFRKQLIAERTLYFNRADNFNDPLDCNVARWEIARSSLKPARFFCLAMEGRDDNLMFAHYADEHRGIRLKFVADDDLPIGECSVLALGRPVIYRNKIPDFDKSKAHESYYMKSKSWAYESEYRIASVNNESLQYLDSELREVSLGARFDMGLLPKLREWINIGGHQDIRITKAVQSDDLLNFNYVPISA